MKTEKDEMEYADITRDIIAAFYYVYNSLGFGFLESVYAAALRKVLIRNGHRVRTEVRVPVYFEGEMLARQRLDMLVEERVVVEIKSTDVLSPNATRQLVNYLKASQVDVGLILHFAPSGPVIKRRTRTFSSQILTILSFLKISFMRNRSHPRAHAPSEWGGISRRHPVRFRIFRFRWSDWGRGLPSQDF